MPQQRSAPPPVLSRPRLHALALLGATALAIYVCYRLVQPFFPALSWGLALAVVGYPLHRIVRRWVPYPSVAAATTVVVIGTLVIAPVVFVTHQLLRQGMGAAAAVQEGLESGAWRAAIERQPRASAVLGWIEGTVGSLESVGARLGGMLGDGAPTFVVGSLAAVVQLLITALVLFYFFRDKRDLAADVRSFSPLSERETDAMIRHVTDTIHATIFGSLAVAAVQGVMGGLIFALVGLPAPVLWGAVMAILATIPVTGTFMVWAPAAIYLALSGSWGKALVLAGWGAIAISLIDNVLYPLLVGKRLRFHPLPVFFSIVGGLWLFGAAGLVLGPLVLSVTAALLGVLRGRTAAGRAVDGRVAAKPAA